MKLNRTLGLLLVATATVGAGAAVAAVSTTTTPSATTTTTAPATGGKHWHHGHRGGGMLVGMMLHATKQLNLTADQQASIKTILSTARAQAKAAHAANASSVDMTVLANPGDPNYATALQSAKTLASTRIQN